LVVEEGSIDKLEHMWDAGAAFLEFMAMDQALAAIIDFAKKDGETLVLITADHATGGLSLGRNGTLKTQETYYPELLLNQTKSSDWVEDTLANVTDPELINQTLQTAFGIVPTEEEIQQIAQNSWKHREAFIPIISDILAERAYIGWTTLYHTGEDVNVYGFGPGVEYFCGNIDNTDLGKRLANLFGWDLDAITEKLKDLPTSP